MAMSKRLRAPDVVLRSYGGERLNVLAQLEVTISQGSHTVTITTLVQKGAPSPLLLGTDVLSSLGFYCTFQKPGQTINLLEKVTPDSNSHNEVVKTQAKEEFKGESLQEPEEADDADPDVKDQPMGNLLLAEDIQLPSRCRKVVKAVITTAELDESLNILLFTPTSLPEGLAMTDTVLSYEENQHMCAMIENQNLHPVWLEKDLVLGHVESVIEHEEGEEATVTDNTKDFVSCVKETSCSDGKERGFKLLEMLNLQIKHLTVEQQKSLTELLVNHSDVFTLKPTELGTTKIVSHHIDTGNHSPIHQSLKRIPFSLRKRINEMIDEMLSQGVVQHSQSPWASPIVLVKKKDGGLRFCVDYHQLNRVTKSDVFPLPRIDDTLDLLSGAKYFTTHDLASGYWQICMDPASQEKTAFITHSGLYEFKKMPFGLVNAPATFQRLMEVVLSGLARDGCMVYLDDILVFGRTLGEHNDNLAKVFQRLRSAGLTLKPKKCKFVQTEVCYLGHVVSAEGVRTDPSKLQAILEFPVPDNVKALRSFLGLASYYRRFIPQFSKIAGPLFNLTKKNSLFAWTSLCQETFDRLRKLLTSALVLVYPDFRVPFILETDASISGLGAVLAQKQADGLVRPIAYASRTLQDHEKRYGITELEGLGVVWAVKHFRPYLYGHHCDIYTDHEALKSLLNTPQPSGKLARWGMAIQELDLRILHRTGKSNVNADALSRAPIAGTGKEPERTVPFGIIAAINAGRSSVQEDGLSKR